MTKQQAKVETEKWFRVYIFECSPFALTRGAITRERMHKLVDEVWEKWWDVGED